MLLVLQITTHKRERWINQNIVISETVTQYKRFNTVGDRLIVRLLPPTSPDTNVANHFQESVMQVLDYALRDNADSDMVGVLYIMNIINMINL